MNLLVTIVDQSVPSDRDGKLCVRSIRSSVLGIVCEAAQLRTIHGFHGFQIYATTYQKANPIESHEILLDTIKFS